MSRTVAIGIQNYEQLIKNNCFYIDKTSFIKEWWENFDMVTLIARPRRFGKTLTMSMVEHFFSINYADRSDLFLGKKIWQEEKYQKLQGTYPVISLSFANIKETDYPTTVYRICQFLQKLYEQNSFLLDSNIMSDTEKEYFKSMKSQMSQKDAPLALYQLSDFLYRYYNKKVIILLDEYDTPMQEAYIHGFWDELVNFTRSFFNATFKTNPWLERAIMTGITRVSKESVFSDLNNLKVITTTSDEYACCFGFTEDEVFSAMEECSLPDKKTVKKWYDGFIFGHQKDIYNPWSVINYLDTGKIAPYWTNTSSNNLVGKLIREGNKHLKTSFEALLKGKSVFVPIDEQIAYNQLADDDSSIFSLLLASGYLKVLSHEEWGDDTIFKPQYELALTNLEVTSMFHNMIHNWFQNVQGDYNDFITALLKNDVEGMNYYMNEVALTTFSFFDTGKKPSAKSSPERFYHGFVLGLIVELRDKYKITSNRESGLGRYDIVLKPLSDELDAIIIEFKVFNSQKESDLKETVANALSQIEEKKYASSLISQGICDCRIRKYGFAFKGKQVLIG